MAAIPIYSGANWQRGHGLGGIMASVARVAAPILKNSAKNFVKKLVRKGAETTVGLASDALRGKNMSEAIVQRLGGGKKRGKKRKQPSAKRQPPSKKRKAANRANKRTYFRRTGSVDY